MQPQSPLMTAQEPTALESWLLRRRTDRAMAARMGRETAAELERLLGMTLASEPLDPAVPLRQRLRTMGDQVDGLTGGAAALVAFLVPDREDPGVSLVVALAEVLFVPRSERTEYVRNSLPSPPWDIRRLLLEYAVWAGRIDDTVVSLTKDVCATSCDRGSVGCCSVLGYDLGLVPPGMLEAQLLEARLEGWTPPSEGEDKCPYHGPTGCCLRRFKSPACSGMLCELLVADLRTRYPRAPLEAFLAALARFRNQVLNREEIFDLMRELVAAAQQLKASRPSAGS